MSGATRVKLAAAGIVTFLALVLVGIMWGGLVGHNDLQNYQVYQSVAGNVSIVDTAGYYLKCFATDLDDSALDAVLLHCVGTKREDRRTIRSASLSMTAARPKSPAS